MSDKKAAWPTHIICVGAIYIDTIIRVPQFPAEDTKMRAESMLKRRGGNTANSLEVLSDLLDHVPEDLFDQQERASPLTTLYLMCVLPEEQSRDTIDIRSSIPKVNVHGIYREGCQHAASSMIVQSKDTGSRTIISHSGDLKEMTQPEFSQVFNRIMDNINPADLRNEKEKVWVHFEGRNPEVVIQCIRALRAMSSRIYISVECEKPERVVLMESAYEADVVFFSKLWVEAWEPDTDEELKVIDAVGAGDTFIAGILFCLTNHPRGNLAQHLEFATHIASKKVYQRGFRGLGTAMLSSPDDRPFRRILGLRR
ncbi:Ribokinase-like protein [Setomelanomma holmii]|uniref:Ribokinase-like protein n=1 Tax=Setomelanomma holmii TaxID=210430 RepID=A0A9P4LQR8_9PLEO|nr:Ribokinase-like protein [Setomelanomma holmii]